MKQEKTLSEQIIFMTGATSGLGKVAAAKAAASGATVIALARNKKKGEELISYFSEHYPNVTGKIEIIEGNLNSFQSVCKACIELKSKYKRIDTLVLNAATMNFKPIITEDQIEETLQVNVLSPVLIYLLLEDCLKASGKSKIIFTSSLLHQGTIQFDDIEYKKKYAGFKVYRQSKLALILISRFLSERRENGNLNTYSFNPGLVNTDIVRNIYRFPRDLYFLIGKSPEKGAETLNYLVETPNELLHSGEYYVNKKVKKIELNNDRNDEAEKLWNVSLKYLKPYINQHELNIWPSNGI